MEAWLKAGLCFCSFSANAGPEVANSRFLLESFEGAERGAGRKKADALLSWERAIHPRPCTTSHRRGPCLGMLV